LKDFGILLKTPDNLKEFQKKLWEGYEPFFNFPVEKHGGRRHPPVKELKKHFWPIPDKMKNFRLQKNNLINCLLVFFPPVKEKNATLDSALPPPPPRVLGVADPGYVRLY